MLIVLDRPNDEIVSLEILKQHIKVEHTADDTLIRLYRDAAITFLEEHTTRVGGPTLFEQRFNNWDCFGENASLLRAPVRDVISVSYLNEDDELVEVAEADWYWRSTPDGAKVYFVDDYDLPDLSTLSEPVRIIFQAGYDVGDESGTGDNPDLKRPSTFDQAILLLVGHWYQNRETVNIGNIVNNLPFAFDAIAHQLRVFR